VWESAWPQSPAEVGAIAALWWKEIQVGHYGTSGGGTYSHECTVMVWEVATRTLLARGSFEGSEPPTSSRRGASQTGDKPYAQIREFLNGLAR